MRLMRVFAIAGETCGGHLHNRNCGSGLSRAIGESECDSQMQRWARRWQKGTRQVRTSRIEKQDLGLSGTHPRPHFHLPVPDLQCVLISRKLQGSSLVVAGSREGASSDEKLYGNCTECTAGAESKTRSRERHAGQRSKASKRQIVFCCESRWVTSGILESISVSSQVWQPRSCKAAVEVRRPLSVGSLGCQRGPRGRS